MTILEKERSENARSYAVRVLLYNIVHLELTPGSSVSENELSSALSLSRTPVREALIELNRIGLVEIIPQKGSYVSKIDYDIVEESRFLRLVMENAVFTGMRWHRSIVFRCPPAKHPTSTPMLRDKRQ